MTRRRGRPTTLGAVSLAVAIVALVAGCAPRTPALPDAPPTLSVGATSVDPMQVTVVPHGGTPRVESPAGHRAAVTVTGSQLRLHLSGDAVPRVLSVGQYPRLAADGSPVDGGDVVDCVASERCGLAHDEHGYTLTVPADVSAKAVIVRAVYGVDREAVARLAPGATEKLGVVWAVDVRRSGR